MQLILTKDVAKVGKKHEVVKVRPGFGRNFLLPRGLAMMATVGLLKQVELEVKAKKARQGKLEASAKEIAQTLKGLKLVFPRKTTAKGTLYGSITEKHLVDEIKKMTKVKLDGEQVEMKDHAKALGDFSAIVHVTPETDAKIHFSVVKE